MDKMNTRVLHRTHLQDSEDPVLYAAEPLWQWEKSDAGQWAMTHCTDTPSWYVSSTAMGYEIIVTGPMSDEDHIFYMLKYENDNSIKL